MKPQIHANNSAKKFGGSPDDYLPIHNFMDSTKAHVADVRHRAILHSSMGCFIAEQVFGVTKTNSEGKEFSVRDIAEQHVLEDLGTIPTVQDRLKDLPIADWMGGNGPKPATVPTSPIAQFQALQKTLAEKSKELLSPFRQELKDKLSAYLETQDAEVKGVKWTQYAPSFNDGDPCTFHVGELNLINGEDEDEEEADNLGELSEIFEGNYGDTVTPMESLFMAAFGASSEVKLMRGADDFEVDEHYDCGY